MLCTLKASTLKLSKKNRVSQRPTPSISEHVLRSQLVLEDLRMCCLGLGFRV